MPDWLRETCLLYYEFEAGGTNSPKGEFLPFIGFAQWEGEYSIRAFVGVVYDRAHS